MEVKKTWANPEVTVISRGYVNGGANVAHHEASILFSKTQTNGSGVPVPGHYLLYTAPASGFAATHKKSFYHS